MSNLDKLLQMLDSPKSSSRYDACEELRVASQSSEKVMSALEKTLQDKDSGVADAAKRALAAEVHQQMAKKMKGPTPEVTETLPSHSEADMSTTAPATTALNSSQQRSKKPILGVLLNLFPLIMGLGYLYVGNWKRFGVVVFIQFFSLLFMTQLGLAQYNTYLLFALWIFSWFDVYGQVKAYNEKIAQSVASEKLVSLKKPTSTDNSLPPITDEALSKKYCINCGHQIMISAKFCPDCGAPQG